MILLTGLVLLFGVMAFKFIEPAATKDEQAVKQLVKKAYLHGAFNELNPEAMAKGFHEDFSIYSPKGESINKYPIANWVESVSKRKADPNFDSEKNTWTYNFALLDVTGQAAMVKVELFKEGNHIYSDYLSLLKFDSGWRIVAKVYHKHPDS